jgi:hypothetical protein
MTGSRNKQISDDKFERNKTKKKKLAWNNYSSEVRKRLFETPV